MAYEDLTIEERQALQRSLLAPPPAIFSSGQQGFQIDPQTRMEASLGLLGNEGRFFLQMAKEQDEAKKQAAAEAMAAELMQAPPLAMSQKAQELAGRDPAAFASPIVQQALQFGRYASQEREQSDARNVAQGVLNLPRQGFTQSLKSLAQANPEVFATPEVQQAARFRQQEIDQQMAKKEQRKAKKSESALGKTYSWIATAPPEALNKFEEERPELVSKLRPQIDARRKEFSEMEALAMEIPSYLIDPEKPPQRLHELQTIARKAESSLSPPMRKVQGLANRLRAVQLAQKLKQIRDETPPAEGGKFVAPSSDEQAYNSELATMLGYKDEFAEVPDSTLKLLVMDSETLLGPMQYAPDSVTSDLTRRVQAVQEP